MRKVLFIFSSGSESSIEELVTASDFSDYSVQGVFLKDDGGTRKTLPFPCYTLGVAEKKADPTGYPAITYPDVLKMVFEAETIIS